MVQARKLSRERERFDKNGIRNLHLSDFAARYVAQRPREARIVVAAALEAAARQCEVQESAEVPESLERFVKQDSTGEEFLGVTKAAELLKITRATVYAWVNKNVLLGWRSTKRGLTIPKEQILGPGKVVPGIAKIAAVIDNPELAWAFLSQEWPFADDTARPLDKLKAGKIDEVVHASSGFGMDFS